MARDHWYSSGARAGVMDEIEGLQPGCGRLLDEAHWAGLAWLAAPEGGASLADGQDWCSEFVEASAAIHGAHVMGYAIVFPAVRPADGKVAELQGVRHAFLRKLLDWAWKNAVRLRMPTAW